jgi:hypothetical protein
MFWHAREEGGWLNAIDETSGHDGPYLVVFSEEEARDTVRDQQELYGLEDLIAVRVK